MDKAKEKQVFDQIWKTEMPELVIGFDYYLISKAWVYKQWNQYLKYSTKRPTSANQKIIGYLLESPCIWDENKPHQHYCISQKFRELFLIVTKLQWQFIHALYGGTEIRRKCQFNKQNYVPQLEIVLCTIPLYVINENDKNLIEETRIQFSRHDKEIDVLEVLNKKYQEKSESIKGRKLLVIAKAKIDETNFIKYRQYVEYMDYWFPLKKEVLRGSPKTELTPQQFRQISESEKFGFFSDHGDAGGLQNMSNTCYMNSALQCLIHTDELVQYFMSKEYEKDINTENSMGSGGSIAKAFQKLIVAVKSSKSSFRPSKFKEVVDEHMSQFLERQQHDSFQFLESLMDCLQQDLNTNRKGAMKSQDNKNMDDQQASDLMVKNNRISSKIRDIFAGQLKNVTTCLDCKQKKRKPLKTFDIFLQLHLDIDVGQEKTKKSKSWASWSSWQPEKECTLEECLQGLTHCQSILWDCCESGVAEKTQKRMFIYKTGPILIICLKRLTQTQKKEHKVIFPLQNLDIRSACDQNSKNMCSKLYDLYAVINHSGSRRGGHFTAICKEGNIWRQFNDSHVRQIRQREKKYLEREIVTNRAYVLFYRKKQ